MEDSCEIDICPEPRAKSIIDCQIEYLNLSVRSQHCLHAAGILKIRDLVQYSRNELLKLPNFGRTCLKEIIQKISAQNLTLDTLPSELPSIPKPCNNDFPIENDNSSIILSLPITDG